MIKLIFRFVNSFLFKYATSVEVANLDSASQIEGGLVVASNHLGFLDGFLVYHVTWRDDVILMIAEHWQEHAWSRLLARAMDAIFVDRYNADLHALREVMRRMDAGGMVVLAPEGTRSPTGALIRAHDGAAYLAMKGGVPVIPAALTGTRDRQVLKSWKHFRRPHITLTFGEALSPPPLPKENRDRAVRAFTDEIMLQIAALLPESYRGIYAGHPGLPELSASQSGSAASRPV